MAAVVSVEGRVWIGEVDGCSLEVNLSLQFRIVLFLFLFPLLCLFYFVK